MVENSQFVRPEHRHRRRRKSRKLRRRLIVIGLLLVFFAAWGLAVIWTTKYFGSKEELGKKYHRVVPFKGAEE